MDRGEWTADPARRVTSDFLRGRRRHEMSTEERDALEAVMGPRVRVPARHTLVRRGEPIHQSTLVLSGFLVRYMDARDGYRQLLSLELPGDFTDLHGYPLQRLDHEVATLTEAEIASVPHERLTPLIERFPHLGRLLWFSTLLDAAMHREWLFRVGRLDANGRIAHFLCESYERLRVVGLAADGCFNFPLTQQDFGEACGLTSVHVNRTMRKLREAGLAEVANREVRILDWDRLAALGEFQNDYLYLSDGSARTP